VEVLFDHGRVVPQRVDAKLTRIVFCGEGEARFVLQHTRDLDGVPDEISWVDVSPLSNGRTDPKAMLDGRGGVRGGALVDRVNGQLEVLYRRHIADWLRVVPWEGKQTNGNACCHPCGAYRVTMEKANDVGP